MSASRQELDGWLAALSLLNGNKNRPANATTTRRKVKSLRQKRKPKKHGRKL